MYGTANSSMRTSETSGKTTNYESALSIRGPASESRTSVTNSLKSLRTLQDSDAAPTPQYWATPTMPTRSATPRGSTFGTFSERGAERSTTSATLEPRSNIFYNSVAASVVGSPQWSPSSGISFELPEIPSESQQNSPAMSLVAMGSSERGVRRPASPALSQVPSVIPSIRSLASEEALPVPVNRSPVQLSSPSASPPLSSTPSPLMASTEQNVEVATPSSFNSLSIASLSLLSPLPRSATPDAPSAATPSSLVISIDSDSDETLSLSASNTSFTQASTSFQPPAARTKAWASTTDLSYNSSVLHPSPSIPSVTFRDEEDEEELQASFDTSFLRPSSVSSSFPPSSADFSPPLRPPGPVPPSTATSLSLASASIASRTGISLSPTQRVTPTSPRTSRPLPRVPISLATESLISVSLLGSEAHLPLPGSPIEYVRPPSSQSSSQRISATEIPSPRLALPATPPSPPSNGTPSAARSQSTPSGSIIVSVTTPHGSGTTGKPSLGTVTSGRSAAADDRNSGHDFDRIVDEIQTYNLARGLEHEGLVNDVRTLKNEIRGLAGLVRMGPFTATQPPVAEHRRVTLDSVDREVGRSSPVSPDEPARVSVGVSAPSSPTSNSSEVRSVHSYLSSYHSDDDVLHIEEEMLLPPIHSPIWTTATLDAKDPATDSSIQVSPESDSESSSLSSSPYASSSELSGGWLETGGAPPPLQPPEIHQLPESIERALEGIQNQLHTLDDGQHTNINILESLQKYPEEDRERQTSELLQRLGHIEDLLRTYLEQGPMLSNREGIDQVPVPSPPALQRVSVSTADSVDSDSLRRLRMFLGDLAQHIDNDYDRSSQRDRMSMPLTTARPTISRQRADDVLQSLDMNISPPRPPSLPQSEIPHIEPFNFLYGDSIIGRGERPRSTSPMSVDRLPPLRHAASVVLPVPVQVALPGPKRRRRRRGEEVGEGELDRRHLRFTTPDVERLLSKRRTKRDVDAMKMLQLRNQELQQQRQQRRMQQQQQQQQQQIQPPRQVVLRSALKPSNATPQVSGVQPQLPFPDTDRTRAVPAQRTLSDSQTQPQNALPSRTKSWYKPRDEQGANRPMSTAFVDPANLRYLPMANPPTAVAMPSLGPSMNILRDQRVAQLATVDQQRQLMRYMKGLNEWMERDTRNRREEFRDVFQTVQDLRRQIKGMRKKGRGNNRERERDISRREEEARRGPTRSRTRSERPDLPASSPAATTPVAPRSQRWTAVPALLQPFPVHPQHPQQQQQRLVVPPMVPTTSNSSRHARGSRISFVPAAIVQPPGDRAQPPHAQMQAQPTIILLPAGGRAPGQAVHPNLRPVDWQYPDQQRLERNGTRRSKR